jgi:hypothetical protein
VCVVYHSPDKQDTGAFCDSLDNVLSSISKNKFDITIIGDMNIDLLKPKSTQYCENMAFHGFNSVMAFPTRITDCTETLIDHIFTKNTTSFIRAGLIY